MNKYLVKFYYTYVIFLLFYFLLNLTCTKQKRLEVNIHYLGHSSFVLQFDNGTTIVTDYGKYNAWEQWGWDSPIHDFSDLAPDVMTYSHQHEDHFAPERRPENVNYICMDNDSLTINEVEIIPIKTCEDSLTVANNTSYLFTYKNIKILHLGDAQAHIINIDNQEVKNHITKLFPNSLDLLFMPIEGKNKFIPQAESFINLLKPKRIIPMHFWTQEYCEEFLYYLEEQNTSKKSYHIKRMDGPKYKLIGSEHITPVQVIKLKRARFSTNKSKD